jgi:hypothetical protein
VSVTGALHIALASVSALCALVVALRPEHARELWARRVAGLSAALSLVLGVVGQRAFEAGRLRAVYGQSRSAGAWLERHEHFGFAALCFAVALALLSSERSARVRRSIAALTVLFAAAALCCDALVHAMVPSALIE